MDICFIIGDHGEKGDPGVPGVCLCPYSLTQENSIFSNQFINDTTLLM